VGHSAICNAPSLFSLKQLRGRRCGGERTVILQTSRKTNNIRLRVPPQAATDLRKRMRPARKHLFQHTLFATLNTVFCVRQLLSPRLR